MACRQRNTIEFEPTSVNELQSAAEQRYMPATWYCHKAGRRLKLIFELLLNF